MGIPLTVPLLADIASQIGSHVSIGPNPAPGALIGNVLHIDTVVSTLFVSLVLIALALYVRSRLTQGVPGTAQNIVEMILEFIVDTAKGQIGEERATIIAPMAFTLALFIFLSNMVGLIPTGGLFKSPTADLNTTLALAIVVMTYVEVSSIRARRVGGFLKHFVSPPLLTPILIIEEVSKPVTLALRLFGNIAAGEILLILLGSLPLVLLTSPIPTVIWVAFSIFVGAVQAFVFVMLTIAYYGIGTDTEAH
ncbi:MAG: synthase subcomplex subunit [Chloroflexi bacterium]|nr:synthase subcomplex subunit [Chloroflexota bacterium]MDB5076561.1 synthase subcomplex subunit [Chloroflexota bacterium]